MTIQQIKYVLAVAETLHFGNAADKCFVTQSTLSTMIGKLEESIGIQFFDRKSKPISVTKEGKTMIHQMRIIVKSIDEFDELVQTLKGELSGALNIGVIPTVAPFLLPEFIGDFTKKFPKIDFTVNEITTEIQLNLIANRELDIGIMALPIEQDDLVAVPLYNEPFVLYDCSKKNIPKSIKLENISYENFWLLEEGHCLHTQVNKICELNNISNKKVINFNFKAGSVYSLVRFVKKNKGLTLIPYLATLDFEPSELRKTVPLESPVPVRQIGIVVHKNFVKKNILELMSIEIKNKMKPLLKQHQEEVIIEPL